MSKKTYLVTFTPSGPYFFGSEKTFWTEKSEKSEKSKESEESKESEKSEKSEESTKLAESPYFIRGEKLPSQSTILGALRYLALTEKTYKAAAESGDLIGNESFDIDHADGIQSFGRIEKLSALFLYGPEESDPQKHRMLLPTPFDHNYGAEKNALEEHREKEADLPKNRKTKFRYSYTPFRNYCKDAAESRLYTPDYDSKAWIADSFVSLTKDTILDGYEIIHTVDAEGKVPLFGSDVRVGVNLNAKNDGFFKREYRTLAEGYSFAVYADLDDAVFGKMTVAPQTVMLGQGRVPFSVKFEEHENNLQSLTGQMLKDTHGFLPAGQTIVYCMGDMLAGEERKDSLFSVVQTKDYRAYITSYGSTDGKGRITKGGSLHKLIRAGSVFLLESEKASEDWGRSATNQRNAAGIGFNQTAQDKREKSVREQENAETSGFNQTAQHTRKQGEKKMNAYLYKIECLTNLHVGSGDVNYNVIDKEVERDPVTGYPTIHASGIKGALRKAYQEKHETVGLDGRKEEELTKEEKDKLKKEQHLFGKAGDKDTDDGTGTVRFFNAMFLARPLRASGNKPSYLTTTVDALNEFVNMAKSFCGKDYDLIDKTDLFGTNEFLCTEYDESVMVEGESTGPLPDPLKAQIAALLGVQPFALAKSFDDYDLPVIARNNLTTDKGNLWYEEYVPHGSLFFEIVLAPDDATVNAVIPAENQYVQIGGNASVGYGYCRFTRIG